MVGTIL